MLLHPLQNIEEEEDFDYEEDGEERNHDTLSAMDGAARNMHRLSDVSLYQQQKRVRLSIPCEPHDLVGFSTSTQKILAI